MTLQSVANSTAMLVDNNVEPFKVSPANTLHEQFPLYFCATLADTEQQKQRIYRLRHQVYCEELQFEPERMDGEEQDDFDCRSLHVAINKCSSDALAGTVRIVTSQFNNEQLPLEHYCSNSLTNTVLAPNNFSRQHICEISRLAVPADIRSRALLSQQVDAEVNCNKLVAISLYLVAQILCLRAGRIHAYVMVEPALARALRRVGIHFVQIGQPVNLNGLRAPHYLDVRTMTATLKPDYLKLRTMLEAQLFSKTKHARPSIALCYSAKD